MVSLTPAYQVRTLDDVAFGQTTNEEGQLETLHLDVYLPEDKGASLRPAILWFHGGGFRPGNDKKQIYIPMFASAFVTRGYVGIAPDYRLRADPWSDLAGAVRDAVADARMALEWVRAHAAEYGIDARRIAAAGGSAGGMVVLNLVHDGQQGVDGEADGVFAVLDMWGTPGGEARLFDQVNSGSPPTLIVHGTADQLVPYAWSQSLAEELAQAGVDCELLRLDGAPHTPIRAHWEQIVETTAGFLSAHLPDIR